MSLMVARRSGPRLATERFGKRDTLLLPRETGRKLIRDQSALVAEWLAVDQTHGPFAGKIVTWSSRLDSLFQKPSIASMT